MYIYKTTMKNKEEKELQDLDWRDSVITDAQDNEEANVNYNFKWMIALLLVGMLCGFAYVRLMAQ